MNSAGRMRRLGWMIAVSLCLCASAISHATSASAKTTSLASELAAAVAAATHSGSVHVAVKFVSNGQSGDLTVDSAAAAGQEVLKYGNQVVSIVLVNGVVYIMGNSQGLTSYFGLPASSGTALSGRWIAFDSSDDGYQTFLSDVALASVLKSVIPTGTLIKEKSTSLLGKSVIAIAGKGPAGEARGVLFLQAKGGTLPVEAVISNGSGKSAAGEVVTFSRWGEKVNPEVPTGAIPISTLRSESTTAG